MEDEILEINGKRYRRSTLIQFGRDHDSNARKAKNGGIVASVFGLLIVALFLATPALVETSWLFFFLFPLILLFAFGGETMVIITLSNQESLLNAFENVVILIGRVHQHRYESAQLVEGAVSLKPEVVFAHSRAVYQRCGTFVACLSVNFHTFNI